MAESVRSANLVRRPTMCDRFQHVSSVMAILALRGAWCWVRGGPYHDRGQDSVIAASFNVEDLASRRSHRDPFLSPSHQDPFRVCQDRRSVVVHFGLGIIGIRGWTSTNSSPP